MSARTLFVFGSHQLGWGWVSMAGPSVVVDQAVPGAHLSVEDAVDAGLHAYDEVCEYGLVAVVLPGSTVVHAYVFPDATTWQREAVLSSLEGAT